MCFQYLVFTTTTAVLFGLLSVYYAGRYRTRYRRVQRPLVVMLKLLLAACIAVTSLVEFGAAFWMDKQRPYAVLTAELVNSVSWTSHAVAMWVFLTSVAYKGHGPLPLNSSWYLTLIATILHFHSIIRWTQHHTSYQHTTPSDMYFTLLLRVAAYTHMGLQVMYGLSLVFSVAESGKRLRDDKWRPLTSRLRQKHRVFSVQYGYEDEEEEEEEEDEEEVKEKQPLLHSRVSSSLYGALPGSGMEDLNFDLSRMNAYEDGANPLSLLVFWWVWPLLKRGGLDHLQTTADLPPLPKSLQTSHIRNKFRNVLLQKQRESDRTSMHDSTGQNQCSINKRNEGYNVTPLSGGIYRGGLLLDSEVMLRSFTRSTPLPSTCTPEPSNTHPAMGSGQSSDSAVPNLPTNFKEEKATRSPTTSLLFLFSAINRAFGWHYYPLGLLKFTTDLLGFSGPLLLYQLVSFIENKKVSRNGDMYRASVQNVHLRQHGICKISSLCVQEPMYYGYLFALGLLSSTLVSALLTSHFNFQVICTGHAQYTIDIIYKCKNH